MHTGLHTATSPNFAFLLPLLQVVSISGQPPSTENLNHDRPAELRCRGTIPVEQSSCCSTETRDDSAHFQETTEGPSVPHLTCWDCWQTEETFTRRCCGVFVILAPDRKLQTYLLTYLLTYLQVDRQNGSFNESRKNSDLVNCKYKITHIM